MLRAQFVPLMMIACIVMFALTMRENNYQFEPLSANPLLGPPTPVLIKVGAQTQELVLEQKQYWRMFSSMFLHAGLIHLGANMMALYSLGKDLEERHGTFKVMVLYLLFAPMTRSMR